MADTTGAIISTLAPFTGAGQAYSSSSAAQSMSDAYNQAMQLQYQEWQQQQQNQQPWLQTGQQGLGMLAQAMGLQGYTAPIQQTSTANQPQTQFSQTQQGQGLQLGQPGTQVLFDANGNYIVDPSSYTGQLYTPNGQTLGQQNYQIPTTRVSNNGATGPNQQILPSQLGYGNVSSAAGSPGFGSLLQNYSGQMPQYNVQNNALGGISGLPQNIQAGQMPQNIQAGQMPQNINANIANNVNSYMANFQGDPGYQFQLQQGLLATQQNAAAKGGFFSGQTGVDLNNYAQGMAANDYQNIFNQQMSLQNAQFGQGQTAFQNALTMQEQGFNQGQQQYQNAFNQQGTQFNQAQQQYQNAFNQQGTQFNQAQQQYQNANAQAMAQYGAGVANNTTDYQRQQDAYNAQNAQYLQQYNMYNQNQTNLYNRLAAISGTGQTSAQTLGQLGQSAVGNINQLGVGSATALGQGQIGATNAISQGQNNILSLASLFA